MYFPDLSPYAYLEWEDLHLFPPLNVGWLDGSMPYPTGPLDAGVVSAIRVLCTKHVVNLFRGLHTCDLCPDEPVYPGYGVEPPDWPQFAQGLSKDGEERWAQIEARYGTSLDAGFGNGEIRVPGDGIVYVAPQLLIHYIERHQYLPPEEFLVAVRRLKVAPG